MIALEVVVHPRVPCPQNHHGLICTRVVRGDRNGIQSGQGPIERSLASGRKADQHRATVEGVGHLLCQVRFAKPPLAQRHMAARRQEPV